MSGLKRFTDFCAGIAAFCAVIFLFSQYMAYDFGEIEGTLEKIKHFLSHEPLKNYIFSFHLTVLFAFSCAFSSVFNKLPWLTLGVSALPTITAVSMYAHDELYDQPMLYVIFGFVHMFGCLFECIRKDKLDRKRRSALALDILSLTVAAVSVYIIYTVQHIEDVDPEKMNFFETYLRASIDNMDVRCFKYAAICFCVLPAVRLIHRDLYFVDALLSLVPAVFFIYKWVNGSIPVFGEILAFISVAYAIGRIATALFCKPKLPKIKVPDAKEQKN